MLNIDIVIRNGLSPGQFSWSESETYSPTLTLGGDGFDSPESAFKEAVKKVSAHYSLPNDLMFALVDKTNKETI